MVGVQQRWLEEAHQERLSQRESETLFCGQLVEIVVWDSLLWYISQKFFFQLTTHQARKMRRRRRGKKRGMGSVGEKGRKKKREVEGVVGKRRGRWGRVEVRKIRTLKNKEIQKEKRKDGQKSRKQMCVKSKMAVCVLRHTHTPDGHSRDLWFGRQSDLHYRPALAS